LAETLVFFAGEGLMREGIVISTSAFQWESRSRRLFSILRTAAHCCQISTATVALASWRAACRSSCGKRRANYSSTSH